LSSQHYLIIAYYPFLSDALCTLQTAASMLKGAYEVGYACWASTYFLVAVWTAT